MFSQRYGYKQIKEIQHERIDDDLRNGIWNSLYYHYLMDISTSEYFDGLSINIKNSIANFWAFFLKKRINTLPYYTNDVLRQVESHYSSLVWYEVFDMLEYFADCSCYDNELIVKYTRDINRILENEKSAYRFVDNKIVEITSKHEIESIEEAINVTKKYTPVRTHLESALEKLSDRKHPDYRNSVKESISAVESLCKIITEKKNATLGEALKHIDEKCSIHPALQQGLSKIYGYTSDADGIRHGLQDSSDVEYEDAIFMLVMCSAFINYIIAKKQKK